MLTRGCQYSSGCNAGSTTALICVKLLNNWLITWMLPSVTKFAASELQTLGAVFDILTVNLVF